MLEYLADLLTSRGYEVDAFDRAETAFAALADRSPDLLVCDVELLDGSGLDLVARLRGLHGEQLPVLMLSGLRTEGDIMRGFAAGATDYLVKPVVSAELLAKISVVLTRAGRIVAEVPGGEVLPGGSKAAFGRYRIDGLLGQGSYGTVFRAFDDQRKEEVALKVLGSMASSQAETRMRFLRETYALAAIQHAHVVRVHDFGAAEGRLYYAMDLIPGASIDAVVNTMGPATEAEVIGLLRGLAHGLRALEAADLVHRDLKPANVILRDGVWDQPVLVDFGLAKRPFDRGLTDSNMIIGTPGYMSPETIQGEPLDARSDLFSLGLIARFALTAREAFADLSGLALLQAITSRPVDLPPVRTDLKLLLRLLVQIDPRRRVPSATALLEALDGLAP